MLEESTFFISRQRRIAAWLVHLFTASGAVFGLFALWFIHLGGILEAFWLMSAAVLVDSVDGILARRAQTKIAAPKVDGALLDNLIDFVTYVIVPAFFLLATERLPDNWGLFGTSIMVLASAYQFTQPEAKTDDHFFKGFPSYWNIVIFYIFLWQLSPWLNLAIILTLSILVFVPIKYVYPSRLDYLSPNPWVRRGMLLATLVWAVASAIMLWIYPVTNIWLIVISLGYALLYIVMSVYRTLVPIQFTPTKKKKSR